MSNETFARRLREAMAQQGMKQVNLVRAAAACGVKLGKSHISQYVSGKTVPRADTMRFLADALHVDEAWLRSGEGNISPASQPAQTAHSKSSGERTMRTFKKSSKLDNVLYDVRGPVVDEAARMEENGTQILKLNIGNPAPFGFRTPDEVIYDMRKQLTECEGYSNAQGLFSARKAIMQYAQLKNIPNVSVEDIYTGNGVSELINLCMSALLDDGDQPLHVRPAGRRRRDPDPLARLSAVDRLRHAGRRQCGPLHLRRRIRMVSRHRGH